MFTLLTDGGSPVLGKDDFRVVLEDPSIGNLSNLTDEYVDKIFSHVDEDGNGTLDFIEFLTAFGEAIDDQGKIRRQSGFAGIEAQAAREEINRLTEELERVSRNKGEELTFERKRNADIETEQQEFIDRLEKDIDELTVLNQSFV